MATRTRRGARLFVPLLAAALLAAACTGSRSEDAADDDRPIVTLPDDDGGPGGDGTGGNDDGGSGRRPGGPDGPSPGGGPTTSRPRSGTPSTTTATGRTPTTADPAAAIEAAARSGVGGFARTLLRPQPATRLVLEILVEPGADPTPAALDHAIGVLRDVSGKPVSQAGPVALPSRSGAISSSGIVALADRYGRARQGDGGQAVIRVLFLRGSFEEEGSVLGVAVRADTAAVFKDKVRGTASPPVVTATAIEDAVTTHELGHLLGLVDLVLDTGRDDPRHPGHSTNKQSVMYYAVDSDVISQVLDGPPPRNFDEADLDDLAALRAGA